VEISARTLGRICVRLAFFSPFRPDLVLKDGALAFVPER
jgi:hypothetical protein